MIANFLTGELHHVGLLWDLVFFPTARQRGFAHNSLPFFLVIMAPSGTSCRIAITAASALGSAQGWLVPIPDCSFLQWAEWPFPT